MEAKESEFRTSADEWNLDCSLEIAIIQKESLMRAQYQWWLKHVFLQTKCMRPFLDFHFWPYKHETISIIWVVEFMVCSGIYFSSTFLVWHIYFVLTCY